MFLHEKVGEYMSAGAKLRPVSIGPGGGIGNRAIQIKTVSSLQTLWDGGALQLGMSDFGHSQPNRTHPPNSPCPHLRPAYQPYY